ncbi:MAG: NAD(P)-binding domain-containing protein, partial [Bacteroidota bacterium]
MSETTDTERGPQPVVGVIGGGSWATALVKLLCNNLDQVHWWMRNEKAVTHLKQYEHNPHYLPSAQFKREQLNVTTDLKAVINTADILVMAIPSAFIHDVFKDYPTTGLEGKFVFSAIKGMVPEFHAIPAR